MGLHRPGDAISEKKHSRTGIKRCTCFVTAFLVPLRALKISRRIDWLKTVAILYLSKVICVIVGLSVTLFCFLSILNKKSMNSTCFLSLIWQDWHYQSLKFVNLQDYPGTWKHSHLVCVCACIWLNVCSLLLLIHSFHILDKFYLKCSLHSIHHHYYFHSSLNINQLSLQNELSYMKNYQRCW